MRVLHHRSVAFIALLLAAAAQPARAKGTQREAPQRRADIVVAGAGASGAMYAAHLAKLLHESGRPGKILVVEAGGTEGNRIPFVHAHSADPESRVSGGINLEYPVEYHHKPAMNARRYNYRPDKGGDLYTRGRGDGGSDTHNALFNLFPPEQDWRDIADETGDESWAPERMARYEKIVREMIPVTNTGIKHSGVLGDPRRLPTLDPNDPQVRKRVPEGPLAVPVNVSKGVLRYGPREVLQAAMRKYPGRIEVLHHSIVDKAVFDSSGRVTGVRILRGGRLGADKQSKPGVEVAETIAVGKGFYDATGGLEAPATMMRSRLGPREELARFGVEPVVDLPGVGRGVRTRNETSVISKVSPLEMGRLLLQARSRNGAISLVARKSQPGLREADGVHIILMGAKFRGYNWGYSRKAVGPYMTQLDLQGNTHSRGTIRLRSLDPRDSLEIKLNMFDPRNDPEGLDRKQVIKGFRDMVARAKRMGHKEILDHETDTWKPISYFEKLSDHEIGDRMEREAWDHHVGSSTRMGRGNDPMAVLGSDFRAKGTQNYFVIGHSAYPKPLGYFPVSGIEVGAVKAADGAYQRYFTGQR